MQEIKISFEIKNIEKLLTVGVLLVILFLELRVTMANPIAFGDEGYHVSSAKWIATKLEYPIYTPLHNTLIQKENFGRLPLWNLIEASFYMVFSFNEIIVKLLLPIISFFTGLSVYVFLKKLYSEKLAFVAAIITASIPSLVTYSVLFYTTIPFVFFFTLGVLTFLMAIKTNERKLWILSGVFSGLTLLANIAGLSLILMVVLTGLIKLLKEKTLSCFFQILKTYGLVICLIVIILSTWVFRNIVRYRTPDCGLLQTIQGTCQKEATYSSSFKFAGRTAEVGTETGILKMGILSYLQFAYGFYHSNWVVNLIGVAFVPFVFLAGSFVLVKRRNELDIPILILLLTFAGLFYQTGGLFAGRAEDTARYFLSFVPIIGLVSASYLENIVEFFGKYNKYLPILLLLTIIIFSLFSIVQKTDVMNNVKGFSPEFFKACDWVKKNVPENSTLFSLHTYPTMYNCERNAIWEILDKGDIILSNNITLVKGRLKANGIDYIFVQKFSLSSEAYGQSYPINFVQFLNTQNKSFEKVFENGPDTETCIQQGGCDGTIIYEIA